MWSLNCTWTTHIVYVGSMIIQLWWCWDMNWTVVNIQTTIVIWINTDKVMNVLGRCCTLLLHRILLLWSLSGQSNLRSCSVPTFMASTSCSGWGCPCNQLGWQCNLIGLGTPSLHPKTVMVHPKSWYQSLLNEFRYLYRSWLHILQLGGLHV